MQALNQRAVLGFGITDNDVIVSDKEYVGDFAFRGKGFTAAGGAENQTVRVFKPLPIHHDKVIGQRVDTAIQGFAIMLEQLNKVYELGSHYRQLSSRFTNALAVLAADIREEEIIKVYGIDAPYYYLTESLCWPILEEIIKSKLMTEPMEVNERMR